MSALVFAASVMLGSGLPAAPPPVMVAVNNFEQSGIWQSEYRGQYYAGDLEGLRTCLVWRESRGHYYSTGQHGAHEGAYQMTDALWRGAAWMMTAEMRKAWPSTWRITRAALLDTPGHLWGRFWQDMAFYTVMNWERPRSGMRHWHLDGSKCNGY